MQHRMRYIMIGGFLGAGKTTTIGRLAAMYQAQGLNVGIVTNDQAADLVDTHLLRSQGFDVGEVAGACFCCSFDELISTVDTLDKNQRPDIILAEPVGSCTDLVATVIQPLRQLFDSRFEIAPYAVILKPNHGKRILSGDGQRGFSPKAEYIFRKQLEEADLILLNRIDEWDPAELALLEELIAKEQPDIPRLKISARTGENFAALVELLDQTGDFGRRILDIDYDVYAEGEAELGWLNSALTVTSNVAFSLDDLLTKLIQDLESRLRTAGFEAAHLKLIGMADDAYGVANLIGSERNAELSLSSHSEPKAANLVINARVATDPADLQQVIEAGVAAVCTELGLQAKYGSTQSFRPGRPVPTHRLSEPV